MSRKEDVVKNFMNLGIVETITSKHIKSVIKYAVTYGFEHGESYGKYEAYIGEQNDKIAEAIIQPENDRVWKEQLKAIQKDEDAPDSKQTVELLSLIAEMILYGRKGD